MLNPKTTHREFFGLPGSLGVMLGTPAVLLTWYFSCNEQDGCQLPTTGAQWKRIADGFSNITSYASKEAFAYYVMWWSWLAFLYFIVPGKRVQGVVLRNNTRLEYTLNGLSSLFVTIAMWVLVYFSFGVSPFLWIAEHYFELAIASMCFATLQALFVYLYSFRSSNVILALAGNSGNPVYDFFIGRELNPRIFDLDLKYFNELRPGIIGWILLNVSFAIKQYTTYGYVTNSMWLAILPQIVYCFDTLIFEPNVLTTMDIVTDGFGWMLSFGDLTWVPGMYSLQARFLAFNPVQLSSLFALFVALMSIVSFLVFRLSNNEKNNFRTDPSSPKVKHLRYITTESGSRLIISGWWGMARHINYTGDWFFGLAQCLSTGFSTPMTYFFSAYFLVLLIHRNYRDECKCKAKYKKDWIRYCEIVPFLFIPYIF